MDSTLVWWFAAFLCLAVLKSSQGFSDSNEHRKTRDITTPVELNNAELPVEVMEDLMKETEIMAIIGKFIDKMVSHNQMNTSKTEGENREEKSISITTKNTFDCTGNKNECYNQPKGEEAADNSSQANGSPVLNDKNTEIHETSIKSDVQNPSQVANNESSLKNVFIVYPEKLENTTYEDGQLHVVLPTTEPMENLWHYERYPSNKNKEVDFQKEPSDQLEASESEFISVNTDNNVKKTTTVRQVSQKNMNKPNLHKLFPKRRSSTLHNRPLSSLKNAPKQEDERQIDDTETSASEIDKVETGTMTFSPIVVMNLTNENNKAPKFPVRGLQRQLPQQRKPQNHYPRKSNKNVLQLLRDQSRVRPDPTPTYQNENTNTDSKNITEDISEVMDEINIKAINAIMRTNFTANSTVKQLKPLTTYNFRSKINKNVRQDNPLTSQNQQHSSNLTNPVPTMKVQNTNEPKEILEENNAETRTSTKRNNLLSRGRLRQRYENTTPSNPTETFTSSVPQETSLESSKERANSQDFPRRRQPQLRSRNKSLSTDDKLLPKEMENNERINQNSQEQNKPTLTSANTGRRMQNRARATFGSRNAIRSRVKAEPANQEIKGMQPLHSTEANNLKTTLTTENYVTTSTPPPQKELSHFSVGNGELTEDETEPGDDIQLEYDEDLDGSANEVHKNFLPPPRMERGFRPMIHSRALNVVGPLPKGFLDQSGLYIPSGDEIGLNPPLSSSTSDFNAGNQFSNYDYNQDLLPPVFLPPSPSQPSFSKTFANNKTPPLPPVFNPAPSTAMLDHHRDINQLQTDFNLLKNQYDLLLKNYAEMLRIYNKIYAHQLNSVTTTTF